MYEHYTRPSVDDIFAGKMSKYALAIAVAKSVFDAYYNQ